MTFYFNLCSLEKVLTDSEMQTIFPAWFITPRPLSSWVEVEEITPPEGSNVIEYPPTFINGTWTQTWVEVAPK